MLLCFNQVFVRTNIFTHHFFSRNFFIRHTRLHQRNFRSVFTLISLYACRANACLRTHGMHAMHTYVKRACICTTLRLNRSSARCARALTPRCTYALELDGASCIALLGRRARWEGGERARAMFLPFESNKSSFRRSGESATRRAFA